NATFHSPLLVATGPGLLTRFSAKRGRRSDERHAALPHRFPRIPSDRVTPPANIMTTPTQSAGRKMMAGPEEYDIVVLGSGEAGKYLGWTLASEGKRTAVIERKYLGGSCPNIACLPSKNVIHSAKVASFFRRSDEFGIAKQGWKIDLASVRDRKRKMIDGLL